MKKLLSLIICAVLFVSALPLSASALAIDPKIQIQHANGGTKSYSTLSSAVNSAVDGDTVMLAGEVANLTVTDGVTITKNITFKTGKDFGGGKKYLQYNGTSKSLFTVESGATLTIVDSDIRGNQNSSVSSGGFVTVKKGGTLILDGIIGSEVVIKGFMLNLQDACGGAVYAEQGATVIVNGVTFEDNFAANGNDIYAEQKTDVTLSNGVTVNVAYGESVDINGLNLILTGEIGLVFHTVVPDRYLDGSFTLSCRTDDPVTYKISECGKDSKGRYLAKYNLSAIELSEPVTLTVYDKSGNVITSKSKTAEEYGNVILADKDATDKEKKVVKSLLNYGHFAQIECSEYNGWEIGEDFAETIQYGELTVDKTIFRNYYVDYSDVDPKITKIGYQLTLGYKTDVTLYFLTDEKPTVTVNGEEAAVNTYDLGGLAYGITINDICALDLAKKFTVVVNGKMTVTLSALSYCKLTVAQNDDDCINAVRALYEFYAATVDYNKPVSPDEDTSYDNLYWNI